LYVIADVREQGEDRVIELIGYRYQRTGYQRIPLDERGGSGWSLCTSGWACHEIVWGITNGWRVSTAPARRSATTLPSVPRWPPKPEHEPRRRRGRRLRLRRERRRPRRGPRRRRGPRLRLRLRRERRPKLRRGRRRPRRARAEARIRELEERLRQN